MSERRWKLANWRQRVQSGLRRADRFDALALVFAFGICLIAFQILMIQGINGAEISQEAINARTRTTVLQAKRGTIYDGAGKVLATSVERYNVGVNQKLVTQYRQKDANGKIIAVGPAAVARQIAPILNVDRYVLGAQMVGDSSFAYVAKSISPEQWKKIAALGIPGIEPERISKRVYPSGQLAGNIIGFVNREADSGLGGVEKTLNNYLAGKDGSLKVEVDVRGVTIPTGRQTEVKAVPGQDIQLTINSEIQSYTQKVIDEATQRWGAEWGAGVLIDVKTGAILALADSFSVDPNNVGATSEANRGSHAVTDPIEPGSTGKLLTYSAAMDKGKITPYTVFISQTPITMPNGEVINDNDDHPAAYMTVAGLLATSYNSGVVQVGDLVSDDDRYQYMRKFGLGEKANIMLPGESAGILPTPDTWGKRGRYENMFGQAIALTAVQLAGMGATIANQGIYIQPHVVAGIRDQNGHVEPIYTPKTRRVISEKAAREMLDIMEESAGNPEGTSYLARIDGYRVAGKTGTAQTKSAAGPLAGRNASFVGIAPAENPRIAMAVMMHLPTPPGYGSMVAAPVFSKVGAYALRQIGVSPSSQAHENIPWYKSN